VSVSVRTVLKAMSGTFERDRKIILARAKLVMGTPDLQARIWAEIERAQVFLGAILAQRSGREPDDYEFRVVIIAVIAAMMEAAREWVRQDGRVSLDDLLQGALDVIHADAMLDAITSRT
jgi:hypothetical protein